MEQKSLYRVAIYIRVSGDKQAKEGDSMREQLETCQEYIKEHDNLVQADVYVDEAISGQKLNRDDFTRLMDDVRSGDVDRIIFTKLDRWFRSLRHYLNTQHTLEKHGVGWTAVRQQYFDTTTAYGRAFVAQSMTWAELEAQNDSERILAVFSNKVKNGEAISGNVLMGYEIKDKHLVKSSDAEKVISLFEHYARHNNLSELRRYAAEEYGILRNQSTWRKMLNNKKYIGEFRQNTNYCPAIVDRELFDTVQLALSRNVRSNKKHDYLFSSLIRCSVCGRAMAAHQITDRGRVRNDGTFTKYYRSAYRCKRHSCLHECTNGKIVAEKYIEREMLNGLRSNLQKYMTDYEIVRKPVADNERKVNAIQRKIDKLKELYLNELITIDEFKADKVRYEEQINNLSSPVKIIKKDFSAIKKVLDSNIEELYESFSFTEKQEFWRSFVDHIAIDNERKIHPIFF